jgi:hypothetical protein
VLLRRALAVVALSSMACGSPAGSLATTTLAPSGRTAPTSDPACQPTDQDRYAYRPARLQVLLPCLRVTGTIVRSSAEADGDVHIDLRLDAPYEGMLTPGNDAADGLLIVEPVCQFPPVQAESIRVCASDPDPLSGALPLVGDHVWIEGRYVLDLQHHAWAELHPLYRWGKVAP